LTGLTPAGFELIRLPEIRAAIETALVQSFGDIDTRAESIFGQLIGISAETDALLWQLAEDVYLSQYPDSASGVSLDHVCALTGVVRQPARPTQVTATVFGQPNTVLSAGREAENRRTGDVYRSTVTAGIVAADAIHAALELGVVAAGDYTVTIQGTAYTFTATGANTEQQILTGISTALTAAPVSRVVSTGRLTLTSTAGMAISVSANIEIAELGVPIPFRAIETGPLVLAAGDLTEIKTPVAGWLRVNNPQPGVQGAARETDAQLRARREQSTTITATNTLDAITARLRQTQFVTDVNVNQNNGTVTDAFGTERQHIWAVVEGGDDQAIARILFNATAAGIGYRGDEVVVVVSNETGKSYQVRFDRPTYIDPAIEVSYTRLSNFPPEGDELMRKALVARTFIIGEKLVIPRLYTQLNTVDGVEVEGITINSGSANILPDPNEKIRIIGGNVTFVDLTP